MSNRRQFVRQTAAVLLAFGLIASLLPGLAVAQDLSTVEARAAWVIEQRRGESINPNAKFGAAAALARLALNANDTEVIDRITHFYDKVPAGSNGQQFSYPGVAWVLGKHWDKFTPAQRDHLKARLKDFGDLLGHGTENHAIMKGAAAYLFAQYWPDETGWVRGTMTSAQLRETARKQMMATMHSLYDKGYAENLSHNYLPVHLYPYYTLYDCATDPEMKAAADAALHFHVANMAANHFEGVTIPPTQRDYPETTWNTYTAEPGSCHAGHLIHWLYWADAQNWTPAEIDRADGNYVVYAALSSWRPPAAIGSLARGETVPYELTASAAGFGFWGTGTPADVLRYVYRDKLYAMGSGHVFRYDPVGFYDTYTTFRLIYKSPDKFNFIECYHPYWRSNDRTWRGISSPFEQWAQHKGSAIALFNIPTADPWAGRGRSSWQAMRDAHSDNLIKEALVRYPKSIDQKTESDGWIFLREGDVYIAIRPLKDYTIDANYKPAGPFYVVVSPGAKNAVIFDIATKKEFATFQAFQRAVAQNPPVVDWDQLSVTYTSLKGDTLTATWNPPKYDVPEAKENDPERETVQVRPDITVNGAVVPIDSDFINGKAVMKSPSVELVDRVMRLRTPAGRLEVDWRGKVPSFSMINGYKYGIGWTERILNTDGSINWTEYAKVANNAGSAEIRDYLLGPKYAYYHPQGGESFPTLALQGDERGWEGPAEKFPQGAISPEHCPHYYEQSGSLIYAADDPNNAGVILAANGERYDYPPMSFYNKVYWDPPHGWYRHPDPPWLHDPAWSHPKKPVAVASATGHVVNQQYLAFENGLIGTAPNVPAFYNDSQLNLNLGYPCVHLPAGKTPMALAVTPAGEFVLAAVWDTINRKGQLAVIAVEGRVICSEPKYRDWPSCRFGAYMYGFPTWANTKDMKLLGFIDLPISAPTAIAAGHDLQWIGSGRMDVNVNKDIDMLLNNQAERDTWYRGDTPEHPHYKRTARAGYAVVASRSESKVVFIDLQPLLAYYRDMYFTTQARYNETKNVGMAADQWPHTFDYRPVQRPLAPFTLDVNAPTVVAAGLSTGMCGGKGCSHSAGTSTCRASSFGDEYAFVATMEGQLLMYSVGGLISEAAATKPLLYKSIPIGKNPTSISHGNGGAPKNDLFINCRGDKSIYILNPGGEVLRVLRDSRMEDPVGVENSMLGNGEPRNKLIHIMDFSARKVLTYVYKGPGNEPDYTSIKCGAATVVPGRPFAYQQDEVP